MDRVDPKTNGMPAWADDLDFQHNSIKAMLHALVFQSTNFNSLLGGNNNCVLWGCELSQNGSDFEITEGYVFIDGEIYYVIGETVKGNSGGGAAAYDANNFSWPEDLNGPFGFEIEEVAANTGNKKFRDGVNRDTYIQRRARARFNEGGTYNTGASDFLGIAAPLLIERLWVDMQQFVKMPYQRQEPKVVAGFNSQVPWSARYRDDPNATYLRDHLAEFGMLSSFFLQGSGLDNGWNIHNRVIKAYRDSEGRVVFSGSLDGTGAGDPTFSTGWLPNYMRPQNREVNIPLIGGGGSYEPGLLTVKTNGDLQVNAQDLTPTWSLEGASYVIDDTI